MQAKYIPEPDKRQAECLPDSTWKVVFPPGGIWAKEDTPWQRA